MDCWIDQYEPFPEEGWFRWMDKQIENAQFVLVVCSEIYNESYKGEGSRGVGWEGCIIDAAIYKAHSKNSKFIPIGFSKDDLEHIPTQLVSATNILVSDEKQYEDLYRILTDQPKAKAPAIGERKKIQPQPRIASTDFNKAKVFNVPRQNPFFTGRQAILKDIEQSFKTKKKTVLTQTKAVHGLGGIGKTQIAVKFAYDHCESYEAILWVDAENNASLSKSVSDIAKRLELPEKDSQEQELVFQAVQRWLANNKSWLLILDNIEDMELHDDFLPKLYEGDVLITTRRGDIENVSRLEVDKMGEEEGIIFLLNRTSEDKQYQKVDDASSKDVTAAKTIYQEFGGLPVALEQVGAYIKSNRSSLQKYLEMYEAESTEMSYTDVFKWSLRKTEETCQEAGELIRLCAFLDPDSIPKFIFEDGKEFLSEDLQKILESRFKWEELISKTCRYSLLKRNNDDQSMSMHRLVQKVIRDDLGNRKEWLEIAVEVLNSAFPNPDDFKNWSICEQLLPSVEAGYKEVEKNNLENPEVGNLFNKVGSYLIDRGIFYGEVELYLKTALKIRKICCGEESFDVAMSLQSLAELYKLQGRYKEAEPLCNNSLKFLKNKLGEEHSDVASSLRSLSGLYRLQGRYEDAEPHLKEALRICIKIFGEEHTDVATSLNDLALLYYFTGRYEEAEPLYLKALEIDKKLYGSIHFNLAALFHNLALLYKSQKRYEEAEPLYKESIKIKQVYQGEKHPDIAQSFNNLGALYLDVGRYKEAESIFLKVLRIRKEVLGKEHPDVATSINNLAVLYKREGRNEEAKRLYKEVLEMRKKFLGEDHPEVATSFNNIGVLFAEQGGVREGAYYLQIALDIYKKSFSENHPDVKRTENSLRIVRKRIEEGEGE